MNTLILVLALIQGSASVDGTVVRLGTNEPLSETQILLTRVGGTLRDSRTTTSGRNGEFRFSDLAPGSYRLFFEHEGYVRAEYGQRSLGKTGVPLEVAAGKNASSFAVTLSPTSTIIGRVTSPQNDPVANATVEALRPSYRDGKRTLRAVQSTQTNDLGEYRLFGLTPGSYFLSVTPAPSPFIQGGTVSIPSGNGMAGGSLQNILATGAPIDPRALDKGFDRTVYAPGTTDPGVATAIDLRPGATYRAPELQTARTRSVAVRGTITDGVTGQPPANFIVSLIPENSDANSQTRRTSFPARSPFEITGVLPGTYGLVATNGTSQRLASFPITVGTEDLEGVKVVLMPTFGIQGRVVFAGKVKESPQALIRARGSRSGAAGGIAELAKDGTFTIGAVGAGEYRLEILDLPSTLYIRSARLGDSDLLNGAVRIEGPTTDAIEVTLDDANAALDAQILNREGRPSPAATVVLVPDTPRRQRFELYRTATSDADGRVTLTGIAPGSYKLFAWQDVETGAWQNADFMRNYEDRGRPIGISNSDNTKISVIVTVIDIGEVR